MIPDQTRKPAVETTRVYVREAVEAIDEVLGQGYAAANPELIASFLQACAIGAAIDAGRVSSEEICATLLKLKPRFFG